MLVVKEIKDGQWNAVLFAVSCMVAIPVPYAINRVEKKAPTVKDSMPTAALKAKVTAGVKAFKMLRKATERPIYAVFPNAIHMTDPKSKGERRFPNSFRLKGRTETIPAAPTPQAINEHANCDNAGSMRGQGKPLNLIISRLRKISHELLTAHANKAKIAVSKEEIPTEPLLLLP
jgi:hypothetical protein